VLKLVDSRTGSGHPRKTTGVNLSESTSLDEARQFLIEHIATYDELEVLLCLLRRRDEELQPSYIASDVGIPEAVCLLALEKFLIRRLAAHSADGKAFRLSPATDTLARGVLALDRAYHSSPVSVIRAMTENAVQRLRSSAARAFPDLPLARKPR
jgi:hypothetical protein